MGRLYHLTLMASLHWTRRRGWAARRVPVSTEAAIRGTIAWLDASFSSPSCIVFTACSIAGQTFVTASDRLSKTFTSEKQHHIWPERSGVMYGHNIRKRSKHVNIHMYIYICIHMYIYICIYVFIHAYMSGVLGCSCFISEKAAVTAWTFLVTIFDFTS